MIIAVSNVLVIELNYEELVHFRRSSSSGIRYPDRNFLPSSTWCGMIGGLSCVFLVRLWSLLIPRLAKPGNVTVAVVVECGLPGVATLELVSESCA